MALYHEVTGQGPDVALLHGWGLHHGVFAALAAALAVDFRVHLIDLPGHGRSPWSPAAQDLEGFARAVAAHLPQRCALVGWSLGGLVAHRIALRFPERVPRLALIATGVQGVKRRPEDPAAEPTLVRGMASRLGRDWRGTVLEFLALEVRGDDRSLDALRVLRQQLEAAGAPNPAALAAGLKILLEVDLRHDAPQVTVPSLLLGGEYDRIAPPEGIRRLASLQPDARCDILARTAHAPFLSQPAAVADRLREFLRA